MSKLSTYNAINKCMILWGIKTKSNTKIYYKNDLDTRTKPIILPSIVVDYNNKKREWYINYIDVNQKIYSCTIDDITGTGYIN
jgi:hypothetical protein